MSLVHGLEALAALDTNLLVAFDVLAHERNVTRAAARMGVTQSAMSHTLRRLRTLFDDPLLVRGRGAMVLTPRAEALVVPVRSGLRTLAHAVAQRAVFEPGAAVRTFRIVSNDLFDVLALPGLLQRIVSLAPGVDLRVVAAPRRIQDALETGDVDLAIVPRLLGPGPLAFGEDTPGDLRQRALFRDGFSSFVRPDHPAITTRRRLSMRAFTSLSHVLVSPTGEGPGVVDAELARQDRARRVAVRVPHFAAALAITAGSDLVLTGPSSLSLSPGSELASLAPPLQLPEHAVTMVWHPRFHEDPASRWLRAQLVQVTAELGVRGRA